MSDVFISYHKDDVDRANVLQSALKEFGWSIWWDYGIAPGQVYDDLITPELDSAKCVIVLLTKRGVFSQRVIDESQVGADRKVLLPILINDIEIPMDFRKFQAANLSDWDGSIEHPIFKDLVKQIGNLIDADHDEETVPDGTGAKQDNIKVQEKSEKLQKEVEEQRKLKEAELENRVVAERAERRLQAAKEAALEEEKQLMNAQEERQGFDEEYHDDQQRTEHELKKKSAVPFVIIIMVIIAIAFLGWKDEIVQSINSIAPSPQQTVVVPETNAILNDEEPKPVLIEDIGNTPEEPEPVVIEDTRKIPEEPEPVVIEDTRKIPEESEPEVIEDTERMLDEKLLEKIEAEPITINEKDAKYRDTDQKGFSSNDQQKVKIKVNELERILVQNASLAEGEDIVTCQSIVDKQPHNIRNEFQRSENITVWAAINAPKNESLTIEWLDLDKKIVKPTRVSIAKSSKYRIWDINDYAQSGEYEVRLRNGANEIIARKVFVVN